MVIYKTFIMSNFDNCLTVWMFTCKKSLDRIENIKKNSPCILRWTITNQIIMIC